MGEQEEAFLAWIRLFPEAGTEIPSFASLQDGAAVISLYCYLADQPIPADVAGAASAAAPWFAAFKKLRFVASKLAEAHKGTQYEYPVDVTAIARRGDASQLALLVTMLIAFSTKCPHAADAAAKLPAIPAHLRPSLPIDELAEIRSAVAVLREEVHRLRSQPPSAEVDEQEIAGAKAQLFTDEIRNQTKAQRLQGLIDIETHNAALRKQQDALTSQVSDLEARVDAQKSRGVDYSELTQKLEELRGLPAFAETAELLQEKKDRKKVFRRLFARWQALRAKLDAHQELLASNERRDFLTQLHQVNLKRKQRAEVALLLAQRKMRLDFFRADMRTFL
jgi:hypothetical protein